MAEWNAEDKERLNHLSASAREAWKLMKARYTILYLLSPEEQRVERELAQIALVKERTLAAWSITRGFVPLAGNYRGSDVKDPLKALDHIAGYDGAGLFVLRDFHAFVDNPQVVRKLRDLAHDLKESKKHVLLISPVLKIPPELEKEVAVIDWDLPDRNEINAIIDDVVTRLPPGYDSSAATDPVRKERIVEAALGLTHVEAERVITKSVVDKYVTPFDINTILGEKKHIIRKSGILEYYEAQESLDGIGGLETLKAWLEKRRGAFTHEAREFGLPLPKGILLIGVPGCGKSLTAKAVGAAWQMPLLRLDVGKIFGGLVGASEENIRKAIKTAEAIAPSVLWIDELEKGFSGTGSSNMSDGGTTSRVFGTFVTWLQEKTSPVFVIATANDVRSLPPELLRKGRFDEIFFVDLPSREERKSIFEIHLKKKKRDPLSVELTRLVEASAEFSGSEVEQAVVSALYDAFEHKSQLDTDKLVNALREIVPLAVTMKEGIDGMREWAKTRARPASKSQEKPKDRFAIPTPRKLEV
jgi:SpoVK/Ycf46/Vps4 family AAA+-type ATPase